MKNYLSVVYHQDLDDDKLQKMLREVGFDTDSNSKQVGVRSLT